ncbi:MAG: hypothetical protein V4714_03710, partial [Bacteroidota bacterium]
VLIPAVVGVSSDFFNGVAQRLINVYNSLITRPNSPRISNPWRVPSLLYSFSTNNFKREETKTFWKA